jgi:hypothetical protein
MQRPEQGSITETETIERNRLQADRFPKNGKPMQAVFGFWLFAGL